ncbi:MAG: hypothetical protein K6F42_02660 [Bacteroidales bacterium]|nr:hypothetical protein [Bacteroidales bacterium]
MRRFATYVSLLFLLLFAAAASAQDARIDAALDRYETICDRCIILRDRAARGEQIAPAELRSLLEQVSQLRATLQEGSGRMSVAQRQRFERIRRRYTAVFQPDQVQSRDTWASMPPRTEPLPASLRPPRTAASPFRKPAFPLGTHAFRAASAAPSAPQSPVLRPLQAAKAPDPLRVGLLAIGAWQPGTPAAGAMLTLTGRRLGAYAKARTTFVNPIYDYDCKSDGTTAGGFIWTSGRERRPAWSVGAGAILRITGPFSLYAGPSYGSLNLLWEDTVGGWARVEDLSLRGFGLDGGLLFEAGRLLASAGVSTLRFQSAALEVGVGIKF